MGYPEYFKEFKNINYAVSVNAAGIQSSINIKDYFRSMTIRSDIFADETLYVEYVVNNGERPEQISKKYYDDEKFYWVILQVNNITDYFNQWPLAYDELEDYIVRKYGHAGSGNVRYYTTPEVRDSNGHLLLAPGLKVTSEYRFYYSDSSNPDVELSIGPDEVTNRQYEYELNDEKARIQILNPEYIFDYEREIKLFANRAKEQNSEVDISDYLT